MNLNKINLNLLVALDALLSERQVTRAAQKIHVTQSAMSIALKQLRELLNDDLLVRYGHEMLPTARALALQSEVHQLLQSIEHLLLPPPSFNPKTAKQVFKIGLSDYTSLVLLPTLLQIVATEAPQILIKVVHLSSLDDMEIFEREQLTLGVGVLFCKKTSLCTENLLKDYGVCIARQDHPLFKQKLTLSRFLQAKHISTHLQRDPTLSKIDQALKKLGVKRQIALTLPYIVVALHIVKYTDYFLASIQYPAIRLAEMSGLAIRPLPFPTEPIDILLAWPEQYTQDPAQIWLRAKIRQAAQALQL